MRSALVLLLLLAACVGSGYVYGGGPVVAYDRLPADAEVAVYHGPGSTLAMETPVPEHEKLCKIVVGPGWSKAAIRRAKQEARKLGGNGVVLQDGPSSWMENQFWYFTVIRTG